MKKIIANFKMNSSGSEVKNYLIKLLSKMNNKNQLIICPPFTSLSLAKYMIEGTPVLLGAQNLCDEEDGNCTGEISGKMIKECGANYVIVGHSERRTKFRENGKIINKKIKVALKNGLKVILCVGETLTEKNLGKTQEAIKTQIEEAFKGLYENELDNIVIAYEPAWAVGSGKTPAIKDVENIAKLIRTKVCEDFSPKCEKIEIVYGGSVDNKNCQTFSKIKGINGLMVGGSCLNVDSFAQIIKSI